MSNLTEQEKRISEYLYGFILGILSSFDAGMFKTMIDNNISPFDLNIQIDPSTSSYIAGIIKKYKHRIPEYLNYDFLMSRMKKRRPDLYDIFTDSKGKAALTKWIQDIYSLLEKL
jgi:hypothetical protein